MYVCLMRHGKAEKAHAGCADSERKLTDRGRCDVAAMAEFATNWWPSGKKAMEVSPYVRTKETAEIISRRLHCRNMHVNDALVSGDLSRLYRDVLSRRDADLLLLIGHSPYLENWSTEWTGTTLDFKTGGMALFDYDPYDGEVGTASLLFYIQPAAVRLLLKLQH